MLRKLNKGAHLAISTPRARRALLRHGVASGILDHGHLGGSAYRTVIDCGAHHGQFALAALDLFPDATVICYEPNPAAVEKLTEVLAGERVVIYPLALGGDVAQMALSLHSKDMTSSFLTPLADHVKRSRSQPTGNRVKAHIVPLWKLFEEDAPPRPALLKIDTQGFELDVLRGAEACLEQLDCIYVEACWHPCYLGQPEAWHLIDWLRDRGWYLAGAYSSPLGPSIEANLLFKRLDARAMGEGVSDRQNGLRKGYATNGETQHTETPHQAPPTAAHPED